MKRFVIALLLLGTFACAQEKQQSQTQAESPSLAQNIDALIDQDQYEEALTALNGVEETEEVLKLKEKTYLNYGLFLEYRDSNVTNMRDKMNGALSQYVEVLKLNKDNEKAITEVEQILGIYSTFPDRSPDPEIVAELKELGFNI